MANHELIDLELRGWQALAVGGDEAATFYREVLDARVLMLLPGGLVIDDRDAAIAAMSGAPWADYQLTDLRVLALGEQAAVVGYAATAQRDGAEPYAALMSSTYVRRPAGWRLAVHQQTPR